MTIKYSDEAQDSKEFDSGSIGEEIPKASPIGIFLEPLLFRLPLFVFVGGVGAAILSASWEVLTSGVFWAVIIALLTVEPLGMHLILFACALLFPNSMFFLWFYSSRKRVAKILWAWLIFCACSLVLYLLWLI